MKEKIKDFEYTEDNYTSEVYKHKKWAGNFIPTNMTADFNKYINNVRTVHGNSLCNMLCSGSNNSVSEKDAINGKTVDFYYFDENNDFWFMGFTDGSFIIREQTDHNMVYDTAHTHEPNMYWGNSYFLHPDYCVTCDWITNLLSLSDQDKPKITPIGRWIEEHTDADIIGLYNYMMHEFEDAKQRQKNYEHEKDIKEYNRLKEKLGL